MNDEILLAVLEANDRRREERRRFIKFAGGATIAAGGLSLLAACNSSNNSPGPNPTPSPTPAPSPSPSPSPTPSSGVTDADIFNFALNLEYLEAQFYSFAAYGTGLMASLLTGTGTQGAVVSGNQRQVNFTDPVVAQYAREIANDEIAHVAFLRTTLGTAAVAQPAINISGDATGAFTVLARAAGVVGPTETFDPYASDENFLHGAYIFEDVGVTAYKGAAPLIVSKVLLEAAAGILAAEAYHAGLVRTVLYGKGIAIPSLRTNAGLISDLRDDLDGPTDLDQGITGPDPMVSNIVPTDANGLAFSRTTGQVLNIVYGTSAAVVGGLFFPAGVNGVINMSAASG